VAEVPQGIYPDGLLALHRYQCHPGGAPATDLADLVQFVPGALSKEP
jgi:hypothetical protein